jgi:hypothetical protein
MTIKRVAYTLVVISTLLPLHGASTILNQLYKGPWEHLEDIFIVQPHLQRTSITGRTLRLGIPSLISLGSLWTAYRLTKPEDNGIRAFSGRELGKSILRGFAISGSVTIPALVSYQLIGQWHTNKVEVKALKRFITLWPHNKQATPEQLRPIFDEFYARYILTKPFDREAFEEEALEAIRLIKNRIAEEFPDKYPKDFFTAKYLNTDLRFDLGSTLSGTAELIKAIGDTKKNTKVS